MISESSQPRFGHRKRRVRGNPEPGSYSPPRAEFTGFLDEEGASALGSIRRPTGVSRPGAQRGRRAQAPQVRAFQTLPVAPTSRAGRRAWPGGGRAPT